MGADIKGVSNLIPFPTDSILNQVEGGRGEEKSQGK